LRSFPERHSILFDADAAGREVRQMIFGVYVVLYSIHGNTVNVLTVRHGARRPIEPDDLGAKG
jgi:plasmid stabilization system protein ParE